MSLIQIYHFKEPRAASLSVWDMLPINKTFKSKSQILNPYLLYYISFFYLKRQNRQIRLIVFKVITNYKNCQPVRNHPFFSSLNVLRTGCMYMWGIVTSGYYINPQVNCGLVLVFLTQTTSKRHRDSKTDTFKQTPASTCLINLPPLKAINFNRLFHYYREKLPRVEGSSEPANSLCNSLQNPSMTLVQLT